MEPKIRLKGFSGSWVETTLASTCSCGHSNITLGDIVNLVGKYPIYGASGYIKNINSYKQDKRYIGIVKDGAGAGRAIMCPAYSSILATMNYLIPNNGIDIDFLLNTINSIDFSEYITGSTIPHIYFKTYSTERIHLPNEDEQKVIGQFFSRLDTIISNVDSKVASLKQVKAASLQAMFPQEGETTPRVRFKGFEGEWENTTIQSICKKRSSILSENSLGPNAGNYAVYGASGYIQNISSYDMKTPYVGIIKDGSGVGRSQLYPAYSSILGTMQYILPKDCCDVAFLAYLFETIDFSAFFNGSSIPHIYFKDYADHEVFIPGLEEQKMIGGYFANLDAQITLQTQRLEKLKQIKSACLDNMFV